MKKKYLAQVLTLLLIFVAQFSTAQSNLADNTYGSLIQNWLETNKDKYSLSTDDISDLQVSDAYYSKKTQINHVYVNQAYEGIKIHNAISSIAVKNNTVFYYGNGLISDIASRVNTTAPSINAQTAIEAVVSEYNLGATTGLNQISSSSEGYVFNTGGVSMEEIPVKLVYQNMQDGSLKLAWDLSILKLDGKNWYSVRVDAVNGSVLNTSDWMVSCNFGDVNHTNHSNHIDKVKENTFTLFKNDNALMVDGSQYNVFPIPTESPNHGPIQLISEPANTTASPFGWHDTNGVAGAEFTITRGNNVFAKEDADGDNNTQGVSPDGTPALVFNYPFNGNQAPLGYQDLSITNLFYMNNIMHDVWYQYGFDEPSGNFQMNNYGNGGAAFDFVNADAQDGSGIDNALFGTPADGGNPRMTMFLWTANGIGTPLTVNTTSSTTLPLGTYTASIPATGVGNNIPGPTAVPVTAELILVDDGSGATSTEACVPVVNDLTGKIAVIRRGNCNFTVKIQNAQDAGAVGVIMANHNNPTNDPAYVPYVNMSGETIPQLMIPSVFVNNPDGDLLINALLNGDTINATLVEGGPFQKDGSLDNGIVAHEYGHGISSRLAGGPANPGCLGNEEQMGEGWSDWFALMLTIKATDLPETGRGIATYSIGQPTDGSGIRPFLYSTDTTVNPFTYGDTNDVNVSQPHGIGTVWATILWDLTWKYIEKYGFDPDFYNGTGGNNRIMQLVLDGLKLQGCGAGFVDGRNGILAADNALTGGEDQCMIWEVFAARGVGVNASQGLSFSRVDQVESFVEPPSTDPSLQNCTSLSVDEFSVSDYKIYPNPANNILNIKTSKNFGDVTITLTDINGRTVLSTNERLSDNVSIDISQLQSGLYILNIKGESINSNDKIIKK